MERDKERKKERELGQNFSVFHAFVSEFVRDLVYDETDWPCKLAVNMIQTSARRRVSTHASGFHMQSSGLVTHSFPYHGTRTCTRFVTAA